jgi:hypothetical protein
MVASEILLSREAFDRKSLAGPDRPGRATFRQKVVPVGGATETTNQDHSQDLMLNSLRVFIFFDSFCDEFGCIET